MHSAIKDISSQDGPATPAMRDLRVLIAAGGTGGHVYPAIAIADALRNRHDKTEILFAGTKNHLEWEAVPKAGYDIKGLWISGFHRRFTLKNILFPVKLLASIVQSSGIISNFNPHVVVACGGYAAGPVGWVAAKKNIPLVIQEQNSYPGVTNRLLARHAEVIFTAFENAEQYLPEGKTRMTGNPTRKKLTGVDPHKAYASFDFNENRKTLLVLGGSGGAKTINDAMARNLETLHEELDLQIIWQCGSRYYDELHMKLHTEDYDRLRLEDFLHNMPEAYEAADLVVSRAGALSCSELALTGKPSLLIPSPNVAGDHQTLNARSMVEVGAAELIEDGEAVSTLAEKVKEIIFNEDRLARMKEAALKLSRPDAADHIAKEILEISRQQVN